MHCYKSNCEIFSAVDLQSLLSTLRFWIVDSIPHDLIRYYLAQESRTEAIDVAQEFLTELPYQSVLCTLAEMDEGERLVFALKNAELDIIQVFFENGYHWNSDSLFTP